MIAGGSLAGAYLLYRLRAQDRALTELRAQVDALALHTTQLVAIVETAQRAPDSGGAALALSQPGSFEIEDAPVLVSAPRAKRLPPASTFATALPTSPHAELWTQADALFAADRHSDTTALLTSPLDPPSDECERLWRVARALHGEGCAAGKRGDKAGHKQLVGESLAYARAAVEVDANNFAAHKWLGIAISARASLDGIKATIERSLDVRRAFERAMALDGRDATSAHLLGLWHFEVASVGWLAKRTAAALFAQPPESSYGAALELLLAAEALQPGFYKKNRLLIGKTQLALGDEREARRWLDAALELPITNLDDETAHVEASKLASSLSG